jgi:hypothetical protein
MPTKTTARRPFYRQGKTKVYLELLENTLAVRYKKSEKADIYAALRSLGQVRDIESQEMFIVHLHDSTDNEAALKKLQQLSEAGGIEFITPVLRDKESQLLQILTDEITVRFATTPAQEQLKSVEDKYGFTVARQNEFVPNQFIVKVARPEGLHTLNVANELDAADEVEFAAPNFISEYRR